MAVVSKTTLKSYFNDGDLPVESNYVDFIDTMGDLSKTSDNRPGVTRLYRDDTDSGYYVRHYWTGTHWYLQGYLSGAYHAGCRVEYANTVPWTGITGKPSTYTPSAHTHPGTDITSAVANATNADTLDSLHAASFHRTDQNIVNSNDLKLGSGAVLGNTSQAVTTGYLDLYPTAGRIRWGNGDGTYSADLYQLSTDKLCFSSYLTVAGGLRVGDTTEPPDNDITVAGGINVGGTANPNAGQIWFGDANCCIYDDGANNLRLYNNYGYVDIGANSSSQLVFYTDENIFTFNKSVYSTFAIVGRGTPAIVASYEGSTSNGLYLSKDYNNAIIYLNQDHDGDIYINWWGGHTGETRIGNQGSTYGNIRADNFIDESTIKSKRNVRSLKSEIDALEIVKLMKPSCFEKDNTGSKRRMGFIAEELNEILPEVIGYERETNEPTGIAYGQIVPLLVQAIQDLSEEIERLKQ
jgi:hypothetical protein